MEGWRGFFRPEKRWHRFISPSEALVYFLTDWGVGAVFFSLKEGLVKISFAESGVGAVFFAEWGVDASFFLPTGGWRGLYSASGGLTRFCHLAGVGAVFYI